MIDHLDEMRIDVEEPTTTPTLRAPGVVVDEVSRLAELGATVLRVGEDLTVMPDPDGNEFCVE